MRTSVPSLPMPLRLWALLLIAVAPSAQMKWDNPTCTKAVVSVSRGEPAAMTCNISNPFSLVSVCMMVPGNCQAIFQDVGQGRFSRGGWQLWVQGGTARLVTEDAQDAQAGRYQWHLMGGQRSVASTTLNVSEPQEPPFKLSSWAPGKLHAPLEAQSHGQSQGQGQGQSQGQVKPVVLIAPCGVLGLVLLGVLLLICRRRRSSKPRLVPQMSWF